MMLQVCDWLDQPADEASEESPSLHCAVCHRDWQISDVRQKAGQAYGKPVPCTSMPV